MLVRRELVENDEFVAKARDLFGSTYVADIALEAVKHYLSAEPDLLEKQTTVGRTKRFGPIFGFKTNAVPAFPAVVVYFAASNPPHTIYLLDIERAEDDGDTLRRDDI